MKQKRVYPIIVEQGKVHDFYKKLIEDKYQLKIFDKKKDKEVYEYFLPVIRNYMLWTFQMNDVAEFKKMESDLQATVCCNYDCNIFERIDSQIVCFNNGIIFVIADDDKIAEKLLNKEDREDLERINMRDDISFECPIIEEDKKNKEASNEKNSKKAEKTKIDEKIDYCKAYTYILQLYKMVYLNIVNKDISNPDLFDGIRNGFVDFTQKIYEVKISDQDNLAETYKEELELEKKYIEVENKFDLYYKNNKMNDHHTSVNILIVLLAIGIILGVINLAIGLGI